MSKIDELDAAAQKAHDECGGNWWPDDADRTDGVHVHADAPGTAEYVTRAEPQMVRALVKTFRLAKATPHVMHYIALDEQPAIALGREHSEGCDLCAAVATVEALG